MWTICRAGFVGAWCFIGYVAAAGDSSALQGAGGLDLTGAVVSLEDSLPIQGATMFVYTASPREGMSPFCPSCYPDCQKRATSDEGGRFRLEELDPQLIFRILVVAETYQPKFVNKVDPGASPVSVALTQVKPERLAPGHVLRGKVIDEKGKPVVGAEIGPFAVKTDEGLRFGAVQGMDPVAVSNTRGEFMITSQTPDAVVSVKVRARNQAQLICHELQFRDAPHLIHLDAGSSVTGRLLDAGKPVAGAGIGLAQVSRRSETFLGPYTIGTNKDGFFEFVNVKSDDDYFVYGIMSTLRSLGGVPPRKIRVEGVGRRTALEPLVVEPAHRLAGRVVLADGGSLPARIRVSVGSVDAWDVMIGELDSNDRFEFDGLPTGSYSLAIMVPGYTFSASNRSLDLLSQLHLVGRVDRDISNLVIELQPGPMLQVDRETQLKSNLRTLREQALRGAELQE